MGDSTLAPRTDAHAVHDLLVAVRGSGKPHIQTAWAEVLDSPYGQPEFARRHSEVVSMLSTTLNAIQTLPDDAMRDRYSAYAHPWWRAVVGSEWAWNAQTNVADIITNDHLNLLGAAADAVESKFAETSTAPRALDLEPLRALCQEWLELIDGTDLPAPLSLALVDDFKHVLWLIENADKFGVARVARAGQVALGGIALAGQQVPEKSKESWKIKATNLGGALLVLAYVGEGVTQAIEAGQNLIGVLT